ncbi:MAG TPA: hypothetical protein VFF53_13995 [Geobacteraceae bacterium]|nr:hypothetical protein [Geobacteraceae bacterium]
MNLLAGNLQLKLLSLLFAVLLWFFVTMESVGEMDLPLAVKYVNIPAGCVVQDNTSPQLVTRISGPRILLLRQKLRGASVRVDLAGVPVGRVEISGLDKNLQLDAGLRALWVSPPVISVGLSKAASTDTK